MKSTRMIGNGYNMSSVILQVKSRISSIKSALTIGLMLMVGGGNVWGGEQTFYAKIRVLSEPSIGGYVYIAQDAQAASAAEDNGKTDDSSSPSYKNTWVTMFGANIGKESSHTFDLYGYQSAKTGFAFKGWSTSQTANSGSTNTESSWGRKYYPFSITSSSTNMNSPATATYYAIFAGVVSTSNTTSGSLSFGDVDMGSSKELTFVFKHAHAGKISGSFSGDGDFKLKAGTSLPASSTTLANCTITVVFTPSCGDTRSGTLTLTGANGGSMSISLTGNGVRHTPSISTTDGSVNVTVGSPATTINLNDRVTCDNTDGDKTYTKANNSDPVTISGSSFSATKAGTYTVNVKVAQTCYYYETTSSFKITVNRLPSSIAMNNGSVNVSVAGINSSTLDLSTLIKTGKTGNGAITYTIKSASGKNATTSTASIASDKKTFSATECGTYTLTATQAQTDQYESSTSNEFTITVNKLTPTIVFDNTENPEVVYSNDEINQPAYRSYNGKVVDRNVNYSSDEVAIYPDGTKLYVRDVTAPEGTSIAVTITATSAADDYYNAASSSVTHNYAVRAKRSPIFYLDNNADNTAKTFEIGQTAVISYNENTDAGLTVGTEGEKSFISYVHDPQARTITVTAVKGSLSGNGVQTITLNQPGTTRFFPRNKVYTFTVTKHQSTITLTSTGSMYVEDTITTPYSGLANDDAVTFSCSPEGSMKMENGKLIALQAGSNKVTFTQAATEYWTGISQTKTIQVNKITPTITTNLSTRHPWYSIIEHPFVSENTMTDFMVQSGNDDLAKYFAGDDEILVYGTSANSVTFTFNQPGNYKYEEVKNHRVSFEIFQPNNRLPLVLSNSNLEDYKGGEAGSISWNDGGVLCGAASGIGLGGAGWDWSAKYIILSFVGIPDTLSFDFKNANATATQYGWHFYQSKTGKSSDWIPLKEYTDLLANASGGTSEGRDTFKLLPSTRYVKLEYHGNFGGRFKNVKITERKEIVPQENAVDFGLGFNGNDPTARTISVDWYNVNNCEVSIIGADADRFVLAEGDDKILSLLDNYGKADLHVTYKHDVNSSTTHTATLHIAERKPDNSIGKTADITLTGKTTPAPQEIIWRDDLTPMPSQGLFSGAAYSTSGLDIVLTSLTPQYISVGGEDGLTLTPVAAGMAKVEAYQAGNDKWAMVRDTLEIEVTNKKVQFIIWEDKLSNLKLEEGKKDTIELTASSTVKDLQITYELDTAAQKFASIIQGNLLVLTKNGKGTITAKQVGNDEYVAVQKTKTLVSRNPNEGCRELVGEYTDKYTIHTLGEKAIDLDGEPDELTFWAYCDWNALYGLWVAQYYDGYWHDIDTINRLDEHGLTSTDTKFGPYKLQRSTKKVKLYTRTGATMTRTFHDVEVTLAKYLELADNSMDFSQVDKGAKKDQSFYINYSNITGALDVTLSHPSKQFEVLTPVIGEDCGEVGKYVEVKIRCTGDTVGTELDTIIISNINQELRIPVSATVMLPTQAITWSPDSTERHIKTTDSIVLNATATSELPVQFVSMNEEIATIDSTMVSEQKVYFLRIKKYGDVTIKAQQAGNDDWSPATDKPVVFHISRVTPTINTYPTATGVVLPNTLSGSTLQGGSASVAGTFQWQDTAQSVTRDVNPYAAEFVPNNTNWYNTISFNVEVEILKTPQTITWNRTDSTGVRTIDYVVLDATASSSLPVSYTSSNVEVARIDSTMEDQQKVYFLKILQGGEVTITALQGGDETYAAATSIAKKITLNRVTPVISTEPVPTDMYVHHFLSNSTPENGEATVDDNTIDGVFTWQDPTEVMDVPGYNDRVAVFTPYNQDLYTTQTCTLTVNVQRFAPTIVSTTLDTDPANYGTALKDLHLIGSWYAVDHTDPARPRIEGTIDWKNPNDQVAVDVTSAVMVFYPTHAEWYDEVEFNVPVHLAKIAVVNPTAAATIVYGQALTDAQFVSTTTDPISGNRIYGTVVLDESVDMTQYCIEGSHTFPMMFTPNSVNYTSDAVAGIATVTVTPGVVFNGNNGNSWAEKTNWLDNEKPTTTDRVTVNANVEVSGDVTIGGLTINEGKTVVVKDGATLTIGDQDSYMRSNGYGNLKVENGGKVIFNGGEVKVNDFILEAKLGDIDHPAVSGQVNGPEALNVTGEAYFDLVLDQRGACTPGWYDFSVPFPVDVMTGVVARYNMDGTLANDNLRNETEYAIMAHYEEIHATGQYAWKKFRGVMQPGVCYTMTINATSPIYRFKKAQGAEIVSHNALPLSFTDSEQGATTDKGWNAMGNGLLTFANLDVANTTKIQLYDHTTNSYSSHRADSVTFTVGSAFRIQAKAESLLDLNQALEARDILRAPGRRTAEVEEEELTIRLHANGRMEDQLFISASEDALDEYEIGHDLVKQGTMTDSKIGRIWCDAYGLKLCDAELPKNDAGTYFPIGFYSPKATSYTLSVGANNSETEVWLTCDGAPVWNLSESAYEFTLTTGTNLSYALRLVDAPRQTPTDIEETGEGVQVKGARKLMIDGKLFIIRDGQTFDGVGRKVK